MKYDLLLGPVYLLLLGRKEILILILLLPCRPRLHVTRQVKEK